MAVVSVLGPGGYPRPPYNTALFGTKVPTVPSRVYTQTFSVLGPGGYPRPPYGSFAGKIAAAAPVHTHRAQYSGIELPKRGKKKKRLQLAPIALALRAIEPGPDRAACRLDYAIAVALRACEPRADTFAPVAVSVTYPLALNAREPGPDTARMTAGYRSDEDEAIEALFNLMPWLRGMKIKEDA